MEILTLILKRRIREDDEFKYHNRCEKQKIVNIFIADDLILFAHGDVHSANIIMEGLEEFKGVSGLLPSIPKSTIFLCNVPDQVKASILQIMPFEEGNGCKASAWFDIWDTNGLVMSHIMNRAISSVGFTTRDNVANVVHGTDWKWPQSWFMRFPSLENVSSIVGRLILALSVYFIWKECNNRIHSKPSRNEDQVAKIIVEMVRLKLASINFKNKKE
ncbi:hypothetical protein Tco_0825100 [Tanacetum coccineum]